jgi:hypothetical protein
MTFDPPVREFLFSNPDQAVMILLDPATAQRFLAKQILAAEGEAIVTIRDYQVSVACDQRWYSAELISASRNQEIVVSARANVPSGCG